MRNFSKISLSAGAKSDHNARSVDAVPLAAAAKQAPVAASQSADLEDDGEAGPASPPTLSGTPPNAAYFAGIMLKGNRNDLARFFDLPPSQTLKEDYHCALRKRVLLQGRMYIFDNYVCFYSSVFGFIKKRRFRIQTIVSLRKKKHLGFPNSIEIETSDGRKEFYTSFLSRDDAFNLVQKLMMEAKARGEDAGASIMDGHSVADTASIADASERRGTRARAAQGADGTPFAQGANDAAPMARRNSASVGEEDEENEEDGSGVWVVEGRAAPPVAKDARATVHAVLPGTPKDFFDAVLADNSSFMEDFLESQGNRRINLSSWKRHEQLGHVRDLQFTSPIKGAFGNWGVPHTACYQSHRFCLYKGESIVFESSQTMTDIPYGDCFTVDLRWDVRADPEADEDRPQVLFDIHVRVPFSRRCLFKGVIESGSYKQVQETYTTFVEQLRPVLQDAVASRHALHLRSPHAANGGPEGALPPHGMSASTSGAGISRLGAMQRGGSISMQPASSMRPAPTLQRTSSILRNDTFVEQYSPTPGGGRAPPPAGDAGGVGALLLSLPGRALGGARAVFDSVLDVLMNIMQCPLTPQMRYLTGLLMFMFIVNVLMFTTVVWSNAHDGSGGGGAAVARSGGGGGAYGGGASAGLDGAYWHGRLSVLQQELQLLQGRMESVSKEVMVVMQHLAAASSSGGADAAAAQRRGDL